MASIRKRTWTTPGGETKTAWAVDFTDAAGKRQRRQFTTKRAADAFRITVEGQVRDGTFRADASKTNVSEVCDSYLDQCEGRNRRGERMTRKHLDGIRGHVRNHILHADRGLGSVKLSQLTSRLVADFRDRTRDAGVSVPTTRKVLGTLSKILGYAVAQDLVAVNAAKGISVIGRRDEGTKKVVPPTKEELATLIKGAEEDFKVVMVFAAATGVRAGELWALRWHHLDLEKGEVKVETRVDEWVQEDAPKSAAGVRVIPLGEGMVSTLKKWRLRSKHSKSEDPVFPDSRGGFMRHNNAMRRQFYPLREKAGVSIRWHGLRHFAVSSWIDAGLTPKTVQTFAGHSTLAMTMDTYGHLFPRDDHRKAMDEIAKGILG